MDLSQEPLDIVVYRAGQPAQYYLSLTEAVAEVSKGNTTVWLNIKQPDLAEMATIAEAFKLPTLAVEDSLKPHQRPKLDIYDGQFFMVLKPVNYIDHDEVVDIDQIALFIGSRFIISVGHGNNDVLRQVRKELDTWSGVGSPSPSLILYRTADLVVDGYENVLTQIDDDVDEIESQVFEPTQSVDHSERIYKLKQEITEFRRAVLPLAEPLTHLASGQAPGVDKQTAHYFRDVHDHVIRSAEAIEAHNQLLSDVLQANIAQVTSAQNEIAIRQNADMRRISAWAAIALAPTAIAGIYGMNFDNMPELHWRYGYFLVMAVIGSVCTIMYWLFRRNKWL